jgi:Arc/MetJ-type ribon-helix-helix transcriptional regulator
MKLSVSLPDEDVKFLDEYAVERGVTSRSAVVRKAVRLLKAAELGPAYEAAWEEWAAGETDAWDAVAADGWPDA